MDTMMLFHYKKTRKRQAIAIAINILILPLFLYFFRYAMEGEPNFEEVVATANNIVIVISVVLICLLIWFLKSKEKFEIGDWDLQSIPKEWLMYASKNTYKIPPESHNQCYTDKNVPLRIFDGQKYGL